MLLTPIKVGDKLFNLPIIALTAHFKFHGSFESLTQFASRWALFNYIDRNLKFYYKNGKIKKINLSFLYLYVFFFIMMFFYIIVITIHVNTKCI